MTAKQAKTWFISGRVQGVGFRDFVQRRAAQLGLAGWTRNLDDGRVEVYAIGEAKQLSELAAALHAGPALSDVRAVDEKNSPITAASGFRVR
jgi:acylphosphatase